MSITDGPLGIEAFTKLQLLRKYWGLTCRSGGVIVDATVSGFMISLPKARGRIMPFLPRARVKFSSLPTLHLG